MPFDHIGDAIEIAKRTAAIISTAEIANMAESKVAILME